MIASPRPLHEVPLVHWATHPSGFGAAPSAALGKDGGSTGRIVPESPGEPK
jgi:hypothetical protein